MGPRGASLSALGFYMVFLRLDGVFMLTVNNSFIIYLLLCIYYFSPSLSQDDRAFVSFCFADPTQAERMIWCFGANMSSAVSAPLDWDCAPGGGSCSTACFLLTIWVRRRADPSLGIHPGGRIRQLNKTREASR